MSMCTCGCQSMVTETTKATNFRACFFYNTFLVFILVSIPIHQYNVLNQACASHRPARAWFLKIDPVRIVGMRVHVCMSTPEAINNYWRDN